MMRKKTRTKKYSYLYEHKNKILKKTDYIINRIENVKDYSLEDAIYTGNGVGGSYFILNIETENKKWSFQQSLDEERVRVDDITNRTYGIYFKTTIDAISFINSQNLLN
jgi:hypothetical protein